MPANTLGTPGSPPSLELPLSSWLYVSNVVFARPRNDAIVLSERVFAGIVDAESPQGIAAEISIPASKAVAEDTVFLEGVQDPGNVGAILRSAAAFGVKAIVLSTWLGLAVTALVLRALLPAGDEGDATGEGVR